MKTSSLALALILVGCGGSSPRSAGFDGSTRFDAAMTLPMDASIVDALKMGDASHANGDAAGLGPVAWWKGDGNANDSAGSYDGTVVGSVTYTTGSSARCARRARVCDHRASSR